jgi:iron complex transport system ATP-binding protein
MQRRATIQLQKLSTGYRNKLVGHEITATVFSGELTCLLGTNGAGKSTLLRTLAAFLPPLEGTISIMGRPLTDYSNVALARILSIVLTGRGHVRNLTVRELVAMGRSPYTGFWGTLAANDLRHVDEAIEAVGIASFADRMIQTLSDGERQKVMIAKALAQDTPIILLDEPTAFLDFPSKIEIMRLLHRFAHDFGKTIFLSTHDLELALQVADQLWLMRAGEPIVIGCPEDLSLNSSLPRFFASDGIAFDAATGLFRMEMPCTRKMLVTGHGDRFLMVCKALRRFGIESTAVESQKVAAPIAATYTSNTTPIVNAMRCHLIEVTDKGYALHLYDGTISLVHSIAEILKWV